LIQQIDGTENDAEQNADGSDACGFEPHGSPNLTAKSADGPEGCEFAAAVGYGNQQAISNPQYRDEDRNRDLDVTQAKPLLGIAQNMRLNFTIQKDEHPTLLGKAPLDFPLHLVRRGSMGKVNLVHIDGGVFPERQIDGVVVNENGSGLVEIVRYDTD